MSDRALLTLDVVVGLVTLGVAAVLPWRLLTVLYVYVLWTVFWISATVAGTDRSVWRALAYALLWPLLLLPPLRRRWEGR